jgi:hypothetical protein
MTPSWLYFPAAAAGGWLPSDLGSLEGWYKADALVGLTNGDPVTLWDDSSAAGNGMTQTEGTPASGPTAPTFQSAILNGLPVVQFATVTDRLASAILLESNFVVGYVFRFVTTSGGTARTVWQTENNSGQRNAPNAANFWQSSTFRSYNAGSSTQYRTISLLAAGDWAIVVERRDGDGGSGLRKVSLDGTQLVSVTDANLSSGNRDIFNLGRGIFNAANMQIAEAVVATATPSDADTERIEGYLAHKWGLTANLPIGHPYKVSAP